MEAVPRAKLAHVLGKSEDSLPVTLDDLAGELAAPDHMKLLRHILTYVNIDPDQVFPGGLEEELPNWDTFHLPHLAFNLDWLASSEKDKSKLHYLIAKSIDGQLPQSLMAGTTTAIQRTQNPYAPYNAHILKKLEHMKINMAAWLNYEHNLQQRIVNFEGRESVLEFSQWSRDFRREYAIGNISECCIALNEAQDQNAHKKILMDYFLDLSIQVAHIRLVRGHEISPVGQIYFVALEDPEKTTKNSSILGVTTVELNQRYRDCTCLAPAIIDAITDSGSSEEYSFDRVIVGSRFSLFSQYMHERNREIGNFISSVLKQRKQNLSQQRSHLKSARQSTAIIDYSIQSILSETVYLEEMKREMTKPTKKGICKAGLQDAVHAGEKYLGTDYLDIIGAAVPVRQHDGIYGQEGFFVPRNGTYNIEGIPIVPGLIHDLEEKMGALRLKYLSKKDRCKCE